MRVTKKTATSTKKSAFSLYPRLLDGPSSKRKLLDTYGDVAGDGTITINLRKVCEKLKYAGVRVLVSNAISDAVECYIAYEERNEVEHAFNTLKEALQKYPEQSFAQKFGLCNRQKFSGRKIKEGF